MTLKQFKRVFQSELSPIYPANEVDSFFYILTEKFLQLKRVDVALQINEEVTIPKAFETAINKLIAQKPIQYILGETTFYGLPFKVNQNVLIPRPETEELVDWIIKDHTNKTHLNIIDIGSGSGCIAISLAKNFPHAKVTALDISKKALETVQNNALLNNIQLNIHLADVLKIKNLSNNFDVIVSNPPYVRDVEKTKINKNVLNYEPHLALFVTNNEPLIFYDALANLALTNLNKNGALYVEINQYLAEETVDLFYKKGFKNVILKKDIFGNNRMIKATFN